MASALSFDLSRVEQACVDDLSRALQAQGLETRRRQALPTHCLMLHLASMLHIMAACIAEGSW